MSWLNSAGSLSCLGSALMLAHEVDDSTGVLCFVVILVGWAIMIPLHSILLEIKENKR